MKIKIGGKGLRHGKCVKIHCRKWSKSTGLDKIKMRSRVLRVLMPTQFTVQFNDLCSLRNLIYLFYVLYFNANANK